jgi:4-amino-4-deoxy-L-arabinose transferase-like glycosyltransferase
MAARNADGLFRPPRRLGLAAALGVALVLALHGWMAASVSPRLGVTADEVVHLTGGYSYWKFNDYRLHPENGTLPMRIAALPWLGMNLTFPPLDSREWLTSKVNLVGEQFFYELGNPLATMLQRARMMIALVGALTVWFTWRWARGLFGARAGGVALVLAAFCPTMLAHAGLATSDITMTLCVLGALTLVWRVLHRATWGRIAGAALVCGLAFLSKMSGVLIVPLIGALLLVRWLRPAPLVLALGGRARWLRRRAQVVGATLALTTAIGAGSLVVLWAGYDFRFSGFNRAVSGAEDYYFSWDVILDRAPLPRLEGSALAGLVKERPPQQESGMLKLVGWMRNHRVLPEAYLWGFAHTYKFSRYRPAFFRGEYRTTGWRTFFPVAFVLKTPLPFLVLIAGGAAALVGHSWRAGRTRGRRRDDGSGAAHARVKPWLYRAAPLLLFFVVYWAMAIRMSLNIGQRHILPTYPVFFVIASAAVLWLATRAARVVAVGIVALLAWHAAESWAARPFYLSYFQPLAGGMERGWHHLVDSSYDWGQGLPDLAHWLETKKARGDATPVFLTYFGADSPRARKLEVIRFGDEITDHGPRVFPAQVRGGWFVISATHFRRVYLPVRGPWTAQHEQLYRTLEARLLATQAKGAALTAAEREQLLQDAQDYEILQFGRLTYFLETRAPDTVIGGSLLAFRLDDATVAFALHAPRAELERRRAAAK